MNNNQWVVWCNVILLKLLFVYLVWLSLEIIDSEMNYIYSKLGSNKIISDTIVI